MIEKICKECGESFHAKQSTQLFCGKAHERICQNISCGKSFLVQRRRLNSTQLTCSTACAGTYRKTNPKQLEEKQCFECGESFIPQHFNEVYCSKQHERNCKHCGNPYFVDTSKLSKETMACSQSCGSALTHNEASKELRKQNNLANYGVEHHFQRDDVKKKIRSHPKVLNTRYGSAGFTENMLEKHGVENGFQLPNAVPGRVSKPNLRWRAALEERTGMAWELEKYFKDVGNVDLYGEINGVRLAVEISPTATHNSHIHKIACNRRGCEELPCLQHGKSKDYHRDRVVKLKEIHGVDLITIFDWMDEEKLLNFISAKLNLLSKKVGAKKCEVRRIEQVDANKFLKLHHLLGSSRLQTYCYGIFHGTELLQVQTFSPSKTIEGSWEAKRLATKNDWVVMGGVSRATKRFIEEANPKEIVAFSDLNLGYSGFDSSYNGFSKVELQKPVLCWSKGSRMILQKSAAFQSADRLIGIANNSKDSIYPESYTNEEVFLAEGWLPVWDCGKMKEVWKAGEVETIRTNSTNTTKKIEDKP